MYQVNLDPHRGGYVYQPTGTVTAFFSSSQPPQEALRELSDAGFTQERVHVFTGLPGASRPDLSGEDPDAWVTFRRGLEQVFAEETEVYQRAERVLRSGGWVVAAFTDGDDSKKEHAARIFNAHHGQEILYWGRWTVDRLFVSDQ